MAPKPQQKPLPPKPITSTESQLLNERRRKRRRTAWQGRSEMSSTPCYRRLKPTTERVYGRQAAKCRRSTIIRRPTLPRILSANENSGNVPAVMKSRAGISTPERSASSFRTCGVTFITVRNSHTKYSSR